MSGTTSSLKRQDFIRTNFPTSYDYNDFHQHFAAEYIRLVGHRAPKAVITTLVNSFMRLFESSEDKMKFLTTRQAKIWLEKSVPIVPAGVAKVLPPPKQLKQEAPTPADEKDEFTSPQKPFYELTETEKQERLKSVITRELEHSEVNFLVKRMKRQQQKDSNPTKYKKIPRGKPRFTANELPVEMSTLFEDEPDELPTDASADPSAMPLVKARKAFDVMTDRGKRVRLQSVLKRELEPCELEYLVEEMTKRSRLEAAPADQRDWDQKPGLAWW